jgi:hypothetical protein
VATVSARITLDASDVKTLRDALHSDNLLPVLNELRTMLSRPLTMPTTDQARPNSWTSKIRDDEELTPEMLTALDLAITTRLALLENLRVALGDDGHAVAELIAAHHRAAELLEVIRAQVHAIPGMSPSTQPASDTPTAGHHATS